MHVYVVYAVYKLSDVQNDESCNTVEFVCCTCAYTYVCVYMHQAVWCLPCVQARYGVMSTQLLHESLSLIHSSVFFHLCRAHLIGYNVKVSVRNNCTHIRRVYVRTYVCTTCAYKHSNYMTCLQHVCTPKYVHRSNVKLVLSVYYIFAKCTQVAISFLPLNPFRIRRVVFSPSKMITTGAPLE